MLAPRPAALIVNPSAGGGRAARVLPAVERALAELGVASHTELTHDLDHAAELARAAARAGELAVALGGDGLAGAVASALCGSDGVLGVLPGGRGNDFGRVLGLPADPVAACEALAHGTPRPLDLGAVNGRPFIGIASCGFDSDANRHANLAPARLGNLVYTYGALRALAAWRPARFELELDGRPESCVGYTVAAANSRAYGGGMYLAPDAELDDGMFDVVVCEFLSRARALAALPRVFSGSHVDHPGVHVHRVRELVIRADRQFDVYADGDPIGVLPATIRSLPGAVRVMAPSPDGPLATGRPARRPWRRA